MYTQTLWWYEWIRRRRVWTNATQQIAYRRTTCHTHTYGVEDLYSIIRNDKVRKIERIVSKYEAAQESKAKKTPSERAARDERLGIAQYYVTTKPKPTTIAHEWLRMTMGHIIKMIEKFPKRNRFIFRESFRINGSESSEKLKWLIRIIDLIWRTDLTWGLHGCCHTNRKKKHNASLSHDNSPAAIFKKMPYSNWNCCVAFLFLPF